MKFGMNDTIVIKKQLLTGHTDDWDIIKRVKGELEKHYNIGSWGTKFIYSYRSSYVYYPPLMLSKEGFKPEKYRHGKWLGRLLARNRVIRILEY